MLNLPKNWSEVTVEQFQELTAIKLQALSQVELATEEIALLADIAPDDEQIEDMEVEELFKLMNTVKWVNSDPSNNVDIKIGDYEAKSFNKLNLGEFIDLEHYFSLNYVEHLHTICAILYKRSKVDEWGNIIIEPYVYDVEKRSKEFLDIAVNRVWGIVQMYIDWKKDFTTTYGPLFEDEKFDQIDDEEKLDPTEVAEIKKEIEEEKAKSKWSWESMLWNLSSGDVTKYEKLFDQPIVLVFNVLSMRKSLNI